MAVPAATCLATGALLMLSACDSQPDAPAAASDASSESAYVSKGSFQCHAGKPWQKVQVTSTADVAPGATAKITVETPPAIMPTLTGDKAFLFCQADQTLCRHLLPRQPAGRLHRRKGRKRPHLGKQGKRGRQ
jgi:hypothetical protein